MREQLPIILNSHFKHYCLILCFCFITVSAVAVDTMAVPEEQAIDPEVAAEERIPTSIFNDIEPDPIMVVSYDDLMKDWYQAKVTQKIGMFNPVYLPFNYVCKAGENDPKQRLTFPCLLSFKFDFVPDNYNTRHPAFIYRRRPIWDVKTTETKRIAEYVHYWEGTHCIGGTIIQGPKGYSGEMIVFDKNGNNILRHVYTKPVPYFELMGQMVKTWMNHRNQQISEGLYAELVRPMTNNMECIQLYGKTFDVEWRTDDEWNIYEDILNKDPDFAEVRFWYANQKAWATDSYRDFIVEKGRALQSHLVMADLGEFDFKECTDKAIVDACLKVLDYAETICGEHHTVLSVKLKVKGEHLSTKELDALLKTAEKYPCSNKLLNQLATRYHHLKCYEKSIPLFLSSIKSGYLKGTGGFGWEWYMVEAAFNYLGYPDEAIYCGLEALKDCSDSTKPYIYWYLGDACREKNRFLLATQYFDQREKLKQDKYGAFHSRLCAYESGDTSLLQYLQKNDQLGSDRESVIRARTACTRKIFRGSGLSCQY